MLGTWSRGKRPASLGPPPVHLMPTFMAKITCHFSLGVKERIIKEEEI
jgi:hypothetical protein